MSLFPEITDPQLLEVPIALVPSSDVKVWATSATHIGFSGELTVNRVRHNVRLDIHWRNDEWQLGHDDSNTALYNALIISRVDRYAGPSPKDTSTAARHKVLDTLTPWLIELAESEVGLGLVFDAELVSIQLERDKIGKQQLELEAELEKLRARLFVLKHRQEELV